MWQKITERVYIKRWRRNKKSLPCTERNLTHHVVVALLFVSKKTTKWTPNKRLKVMNLWKCIRTQSERECRITEVLYIIYYINIIFWVRKTEKNSNNNQNLSTDYVFFSSVRKTGYLLFLIQWFEASKSSEENERTPAFIIHIHLMTFSLVHYKHFRFVWADKWKKK